MSKTKKSRTADKLIDSVLSDLNEDEKKSSDEVSNPFLDALRETRSEASGTNPGYPFPEPQESAINDPPEGLVQKPKKTVEAILVPKSDASPQLVDAKRVDAKLAPQIPPIPVPEDSATMQLRDSTESEKDSDRTDSTQSAGLSTNLTDRTQPMAGLQRQGASPVKAAFGYGRPSGRDISSGLGGNSDAQMVQAENLRLAQTRILELENEAEKLRQENELLTAAGTIAKTRLDELTEKIHAVERSKMDTIEQSSLEMKILRESLQDRDREMNKAKRKVEELETRLNSDLKKIRARERELENRLELSRLEKTALVRSKDENILDLKRKMDLMSSELENYKQRTGELQEKIDNQHDQIGRTVRALRLALTNLESSDSMSDAVLPMKKAE